MTAAVDFVTTSDGSQNLRQLPVLYCYVIDFCYFTSSSALAVMGKENSQPVCSIYDDF